MRRPGAAGALAVVAALAAVVASTPSSRAAVTVPPGTDITDASGIWQWQAIPPDYLPKYWYGTYPFDVDSDGDMDVLLAPHARPAHLMINDGTGHFTERFEHWNTRDRHGCTWGDVDQNGHPDLYCARGAESGTITKENELWMQQPDGSFVRSAAAFGVLDRFGRGRQPEFVDVNHDPWPDLFVLNDYPRDDGKPTPSRLFINEGGAGFRDAPEYGLDTRVGSPVGIFTCLQAVDYDGDGWEDLVACGKDGLMLFRNVNGSRFVNRAVGEGVKSGVWLYARADDMNGDGRLDLVGVGEKSLFVQLGTPAGFRRPVVVRSFAFGRQVATGDVNGDGRPEIYTARGRLFSRGPNPPDFMFVNDGTGTRFLKAPVPQVASGSGDTVRAADVTGDGVPEFLVTNGYNTPKGVRMITFSPPPWAV